MVTKIDPKSIKIEIRFLNRFWERFGAAREGRVDLDPGPFWEPFSTKSRKNGIQKGIQNSMSKKYRKRMRKGSQHEAKM